MNATRNPKIKIMSNLRRHYSFAMDRRSWLSFLGHGLAFSSMEFLRERALGAATLIVQLATPSLHSTASQPKILPTSLVAIQGTITPVDQFFVRNHHNEPDLMLA